MPLVTMAAQRIVLVSIFRKKLTKPKQGNKFSDTDSDEGEGEVYSVLAR